MDNTTPNPTITILGSGISALTTAYWLLKAGLNVQIFTPDSEAGGSMQTRSEGDFLIDYGPNSGLETTPLIRTIVDDIGLRDEMIYANEQSNKRYILKHGTLRQLPTGLKPFLTTRLFSLSGKLRLFKEPFVGKSEDGYYQSIASFVRRRLGKQFLDYAIDPFVSGVFAGDPEKLSVKSAFPKLYRLEEVYGGLIKGMIKGAKERKKNPEQSKQAAKMFSFKSGMQIFPGTLAAKMKGMIRYNTKIQNIKPLSGAGFLVRIKTGDTEFEVKTDILLSTIPAFSLAESLPVADAAFRNHLTEIFYPKVMVLFIAFEKKAIAQPLDGFGFLIPSKEKRSYLGAIWSSTIFPNRAPEDCAAFTVFIGGARNEHLLSDQNDALIETVTAELKSTMGISENPVFQTSKLWQRAIPQYNIGYIEHERAFIEYENKYPGFFISGNFRGGISVGDCVKNSRIVADSIITFVNKERTP